MLGAVERVRALPGALLLDGAPIDGDVVEVAPILVAALNLGAPVAGLEHAALLVDLAGLRAGPVGPSRLGRGRGTRRSDAACRLCGGAATSRGCGRRRRRLAAHADDWEKHNGVETSHSDVGEMLGNRSALFMRQASSQ